MNQQTQRQSGYATNPNHKVTFVPSPKRVRTVFAGTTVADSMATLLVRETMHTPVYYFPRADVRMDLLRPTDHGTHCPYKGDASYWSIEVDGRIAENAVWSYPTPFDEVAGLKDYVAFYWDRMDSWWEEDEEVFVHPRDPFVRVDVVASQRRVTVTAAGRPLADTVRALFLYETGHPVRYYIPPEDVAMNRLAESDHVTACPYKGTAHHMSLKDGNDEVAWLYLDPLPEVARIANHLCFYPEKVDSIEVAPPAQT